MSKDSRADDPRYQVAEQLSPRAGRECSWRIPPEGMVAPFFTLLGFSPLGINTWVDPDGTVRITFTDYGGPEIFIGTITKEADGGLLVSGRWIISVTYEVPASDAEVCLAILRRIHRPGDLPPKAELLGIINGFKTVVYKLVPGNAQRAQTAFRMPGGLLGFVTNNSGAGITVIGHGPTDAAPWQHVYDVRVQDAENLAFHSVKVLPSGRMIVVASNRECTDWFLQEWMIDFAAQAASPKSGRFLVPPYTYGVELLEEANPKDLRGSAVLITSPQATQHMYGTSRTARLGICAANRVHTFTLPLFDPRTGDRVVGDLPLAGTGIARVPASLGGGWLVTGYRGRPPAQSHPFGKGTIAGALFFVREDTFPDLH